MKKILLLSLSLFCFINYASAQRKLLRGIMSNGSDSTRKSRIIILPALSYTQETGLEYGIASLISFFTDKDTLTRTSTLGALVARTTKNQTFVTIKPDIWSRGNRFHYLADLKYRDLPINFYGVGDQTRKVDEEKITQELIKVNIEIEKKLRRESYSGLTLNYENHKFTDKAAGGLYESSPLVKDRDGGRVLFLGFSQIIDSRNSNLYATRGTYLKFNYSYAPDFFGGENFSGSLARADFRTFKSYNPKTVLGLNFNYQTIQGNSTPFYLLQQMGNDQVMRGYYTGRYRDRNLLAGQLELRYRIISQCAFVGFGGAGTVYNSKIDFGELKQSYGAGFRYFFDTVRSQSLRLDYAFGEKRSGEKRQKGFYLSFGEAF